MPHVLFLIFFTRHNYLEVNPCYSVFNLHVHLKYDPENTPKYLSSRNESMNPSKDSYMNVHAAFLASEYPVFPGSFVEKTLSPLNCLCSLVRDQNYICVCQFLSSFFSQFYNLGFFFFICLFLKINQLISGCAGSCCNARTSHCGSASCCGVQAHGFIIVASGLSCPEAGGIFLDQGQNPCPLHWQADSYPLLLQEVQVIYSLSVICLSILSPVLHCLLVTTLSSDYYTVF